MPEAYEVLRICRYLVSSGLEGKQLCGFEVLPGGEKIIKNGSLDSLVNWRLLRLSTKAKYTFLSFDQGTLVWHYRFTGIPHVVGKSYSGQLYTLFNLPVHDLAHRFSRIKFNFEEGLQLNFVDIRCLSDIKIFPGIKKEELEIFNRLAPDLTKYQPEPFTEWQLRMKRKKRDLKTELKDQYTLPSGVGNYLACEILAFAGLNPWQEAASLSKKDYQNLCLGIQRVKELCEKQANYQWLQVFNRTSCGKCGGPVSRKKHRRSGASQTTHYCFSCQR